MKCLLSLEQIFDRCASWEDPTKWVVLRYPWNKDHSRVLHTLRKLRQVDVVLNRNQLGSDNGKMTYLFIHRSDLSAVLTCSMHLSVLCRAHFVKPLYYIAPTSNFCPEPPFLKVPKGIRNLTIREQFYSQKVSGVLTSPLLCADEL